MKKVARQALLLDRQEQKIDGTSMGFTPVNQINLKLQSLLISGLD